MLKKIRKEIIIVLAVIAFLYSQVLTVSAEPDIAGKPTLSTINGPSYFLWKDGNIYHLRWVTKGDVNVFCGNISTNGIFYAVKWVRLEKADKAWKEGQNYIFFKSTNSGNVEGVDFCVSNNANWFTFDILIDGKKKKDNVYIGSLSSNPSMVPFTYYCK